MKLDFLLAQMRSECLLISAMLQLHVLPICASGVLRQSSTKVREACEAVSHRSKVQLKNLWKTCCDRWNADGTVTCFGPQGRQGWDARLCCSALEQPKSLMVQLWNRKIERIDSMENMEMHNYSPNESNILNFLAVAYYKTGVTLTYSLFVSCKLIS